MNADDYAAFIEQAQDWHTSVTNRIVNAKQIAAEVQQDFDLKVVPMINAALNTVRAPGVFDVVLDSEEAAPRGSITVRPKMLPGQVAPTPYVLKFRLERGTLAFSSSDVTFEDHPAALIRLPRSNVDGAWLQRVLRSFVRAALEAHHAAHDHLP